MVLFKRFTADTNVDDRRQVHYLKKRLVPFSRSPFRSNYNGTILPGTTISAEPTPREGSFATQSTVTHDRRGNSSATSFVDPLPDKYDDQPIGERPPFWLELSGDLAWTTTFSSLTNNAAISAPGDVVNYGVFFAITWQLWASQAAYDIRFYTNDWWHRIFFVLQLTVYGALSAFTADFDIFWYLDNSSAFTGDAPELTADAIRKRTARIKELSFLGIALVIAISRFLLLIQYLRVAYYRHRHHYLSWKYRITPISIGVSGVLFLSCFLMLKFVRFGRTTAILQFFFWGSAMAIEIVGHAFTPHDDKAKLTGHGSITNRLSTLTVIVLGEGLNSICSNLHFSVGAIGAGPLMILMILSLAFALYFIWLCYFDGFRERMPPKKAVREIWFLLHLPFHLSLILLLEGMKNILLQTSLIISDRYLGTIMGKEGISDPNSAAFQELDSNLQKLGMSLAQQLQDSEAAFQISELAGNIQIRRWGLTVIFKLFEQYQDEIDEEVTFNFQKYMTGKWCSSLSLSWTDRLSTISRSGKTDDRLPQEDLAASSNDTTTNGPNFDKIIVDLNTPLYTATTWLVPIAGVVILLVGVLNYVQRRPKDRFEWGSVLNKIIAGILLVVLVLINQSKDDENASLWRMPTVGIVLAAVSCVDAVLLKLSVSSITKREAGYSKPISGPHSYSRVDTGDSSMIPLNPTPQRSPPRRASRHARQSSLMASAQSVAYFPPRDSNDSPSPRFGR